ESSAPGRFGPEIDVDLHADGKWTRLGQIHEHFDRIDIGYVALRTRADTAGLDKRSNEGDLARELSIAKGIGADFGGLSKLDVSEIVLIELRAHAQRRNITKQQQRRRSRGRRHFAGLGVDLQHGAGNRRAKREFVERGRRGPQLRAGDSELA